MDALVALSEQKGQLIIFISHHSRKFDINDVHGSNLIIWKQPTLADTMWERDELQTYVLRAWEFFQKLYPKLESDEAHTQEGASGLLCDEPPAHGVLHLQEHVAPVLEQ